MLGLCALESGLIRTSAKREEKRRTLILCRVDPNPAAVAGDNAGDRRQTDAGTFEFGCWM